MQHKICPDCSADLTCGSAAGECWCMAYTPVGALIEGKDCLCETCLQKVITDGQTVSKEKQPEQEPDYYIEGGFYVFTRAYHLKRGSCCNNGCRHCPYGLKNNSSTANTE